MYMPIPFARYYCWTVLRMISFSLEYSKSSSDHFLGYLAYLLYPPLLYAGPLVKYQDFMKAATISHDSKAASISEVIAYGLLLYALSITSNSFALCNHIGNLWLWQEKISAF